MKKKNTWTKLLTRKKRKKEKKIKHLITIHQWKFSLNIYVIRTGYNSSTTIRNSQGRVLCGQNQTEPCIVAAIEQQRRRRSRQRHLHEAKLMKRYRQTTLGTGRRRRTSNRWPYNLEGNHLNSQKEEDKKWLKEKESARRV